MPVVVVVVVSSVFVVTPAALVVMVAPLAPTVAPFVWVALHACLFGLRRHPVLMNCKTHRGVHFKRFNQSLQSI